MDITTEKIFPSGGYLVSTRIEDVLYKRQYIGYTKAECKRMFALYLKEIELKYYRK